MHRELEKCERALTEYLDMKKNVFPRYGKILCSWIWVMRVRKV